MADKMQGILQRAQFMRLTNLAMLPKPWWQRHLGDSPCKANCLSFSGTHRSVKKQPVEIVVVQVKISWYACGILWWSPSSLRPPSLIMTPCVMCISASWAMVYEIFWSKRTPQHIYCNAVYIQGFRKSIVRVTSFSIRMLELLAMPMHNLCQLDLVMHSQLLSLTWLVCLLRLKHGALRI